MNRRSFLRTASLAMAGSTAGCKSTFSAAGCAAKKPITIEAASCDFEREPLIRPFGFKGGALNSLWQSAAMVRSSGGKSGIGLSTYSVLWSDAQVFIDHSNSGGNAMMFAMTNHALNLLKGHSFSDPVALNDELFEEVYKYGKKICGRPDLRPTFALNALVSVDNAIWMLYARERGITNFDALIPERYKPALSCRHSKVASIPLIAYNVPVNEIKSAADQGYFFMKIKIGQSGAQDEMLRKDMERLTAVHRALDSYRTPYTKNGRLPYYFDANGRYEKKESLMRLLDHARKIGAFEQISVIEEPFDELRDIDVRDIPVRLAADESAHTDTHVVERIQMGYRAIALKAIAKTLSMTMKIANTAKKHDVPCFCADLTVNPILIEWNKNVAARLDAFPGLNGLGLVETNGHQNYKNWETMRGYHPYPNADWTQTKQGVFNLDSDFYARSGGIFAPLPHYEAMFART